MVNPSTAFRSVGVFVQKNKPAILMGIGIGSGVITTILAVNGTIKALPRIEDEINRQNYELSKAARDLGYDKCEQVDKLKPVELIKVAGPCYVPAFASGLLSLGCLLGAYSSHAGRNAALATAYTLSETALREYKNKVVETVGEKKEQIIKDAIAKDRLEKDPVSNHEVIVTPYGSVRCYDPHAGRYFTSSKTELEKIQNEVNERLIKDGYISLNEFYDAIGLEHTEIGSMLGWRVDCGLLELYFSSHLDSEGVPCLAMDYNIVPKYDYDKNW